MMIVTLISSESEELSHAENANDANVNAGTTNLDVKKGTMLDYQVFLGRQQGPFTTVVTECL